MAKVLILANLAAGIYSFRNELLIRLVKEGYEVVLSVPDDTRDPEFETEGVRVVHTKISRRGMNPLRDLRLYVDYRQLLKKERPDIVLTYTIKPNIYGGYACRKLNIPYVTTITGLGSTFEQGGVILKLVVYMYRKALKECSCLVFQNDENRSAFETHHIYGKKHITVNGSGVNLEKNAPAPYPGHKEDGITRFAFIGRIMREKGIDEYLKAARRLHEEYGDRVSFSAIGFFEDQYEETIRRAEQDGILRYIPFTKEIRPLMIEADVIVNPSYHEGMSNVLMEAAATARPVVASDISGCRELVRDGESGYLAGARDEMSLIRAMEQFMKRGAEERAAMGLAGRKLMEEHFDRNRIVDTYVREIHEAIGRPDNH